MSSDNPSPEGPTRRSAVVLQRHQGVLQHYSEEKHWGVITRGDGSKFRFSSSQLECSLPYDGESLTFTIAKDRSGRDEAREVQRLQQANVTGDILSWHVDPSTHEGRGFIAPSDGSAPLPFAGRDLIRTKTPSGRFLNPRPWHAARFSLTTLKDGSQRAVDVSLDWRFPLYRLHILVTRTRS